MSYIYLHMRTTLTISLTPQQKKKVQDLVASGRYQSSSEFFRDLFRHWEYSESFIHEVHASQKEYKTGNWKTLNSLEDLVN